MFDSLAKDRIIAKITASFIILGIGAIIFYNPDVFQDTNVKEISLVALGGAIGFLFAKD